MARALYILGLLFVGGALIAVLSAETAWMPIPDVKAELVKIGLQVFIFGLLGGGVKLLLDRQAELRDFRRQMLERLGKAHKEVYRIRRLLGINAEDTPKLIGELMDARQDLGAAYHLARIWGFARSLTQIQRETEGMRAYLEAVIVGALAADDAPERTAYISFLDWRGGSGAYDAEFKERYVRAKQLVDPNFQVEADRGRH
jgi:hypothetical protein